MRLILISRYTFVPTHYSLIFSIILKLFRYYIMSIEHQQDAKPNKRKHKFLIYCDSARRLWILYTEDFTPRVRQPARRTRLKILNIKQQNPIATTVLVQMQPSKSSFLIAADSTKLDNYWYVTYNTRLLLYV